MNGPTKGNDHTRGMTPFKKIILRLPAVWMASTGDSREAFEDALLTGPFKHESGIRALKLVLDFVTASVTKWFRKFVLLQATTFSMSCSLSFSIYLSLSR